MTRSGGGGFIITHGCCSNESPIRWLTNPQLMRQCNVSTHTARWTRSRLGGSRPCLDSCITLTRTTRLSEEAFVWSCPEPVKQLCRTSSLHALTSSRVLTLHDRSIISMINLSEHVPGGNANLANMQNKLVLLVPGWETVWWFDPLASDGVCVALALGSTSATTAWGGSYRKNVLPTTMKTTRDKSNVHLFGGPDPTMLLRILNQDSLVEIRDPNRSVGAIVVPVAEDEFLIAERDGITKALLKRESNQQWIIHPIQVTKGDYGISAAKLWSFGKLGVSPKTYLRALRPNELNPNQLDVFEAPRDDDDSKKTKLERDAIWDASPEIVASVTISKDLKNVLELVHVQSQMVKRIEMGPIAGARGNLSVESVFVDEDWVYTVETGSIGKGQESPHSFVRAYEANPVSLEKAEGQWRKMWGLPTKGENDNREQIASSKTPPEAKDPKFGKVDDLEHFGGNTWAGGTGGSETAGLGGRGGYMRLDKGHRIHQISDELKNQVSEDVKRRARELGLAALKERLKEINMNERAHEEYQQIRERVQTDLSLLRGVLESSAAANLERTWLKNCSDGELDDSKIVDAFVGERLIYKRRALKEPSPGSMPDSPLLVRVVVDVSGSMYRFQSMDGRLDRMIESTLMLLEAFEGMDNRFRLSVVGHSGESSQVNLAEWGLLPKNDAERYNLLQSAIAHSQYCVNGDSTLEAAVRASESVLKQDPENGGLVLLISDANLNRYGIGANELAHAISSPTAPPSQREKVKTHVVFIASIGDQADIWARELPLGRASVCLQSSDLVHIVRDVLSDFASSAALNAA